MTARQKLLEGLQRVTGLSGNDLMNFLQVERPLISDLAITISEVPEGDLQDELNSIEGRLF